MICNELRSKDSGGIDPELVGSKAVFVGWTVGVYAEDIVMWVVILVSVHDNIYGLVLQLGCGRDLDMLLTGMDVFGGRCNGDI